MDIWHKLKELKTPIVLYGMGNGGDIMLGEMEKRGIKCDGVFASDDFVRQVIARKPGKRRRGTALPR